MAKCLSGLSSPTSQLDPSLTYGSRQRRYFYYLTGCDLPDSYFTYDIATETSTLYIPPIEPESVIWSGLPLSDDEALARYDVDKVDVSINVPANLAHPRPSSESAVYAIEKQISDHVSFLEFDLQDYTLLKLAIEECRAIKDDYEIALTIKANQISTIAHTACLKAVKKAKNERELEGLFIERCIANGAREQAYHGIFASGEAAATLHYVKNNEPLQGKLNLLLDAGGEYGCYASDIVRLFPYMSKNILMIRTTDTHLPYLRHLQPRITRNLRHRAQDARSMHKLTQRRCGMGQCASHRTRDMHRWPA